MEHTRGLQFLQTAQRPSHLHLFKKYGHFPANCFEVIEILGEAYAQQWVCRAAVEIEEASVLLLT